MVIFNENLISVAERFLKKGSKVYLEGSIETRKYEKDGREMYTTEVVLRPYRGDLTLLDGAQDRQGESGAAERGSGATSAAAGPKLQRAGPSVDFDDEVPF